jgi:hypothetical protein
LLRKTVLSVDLYLGVVVGCATFILSLASPFVSDSASRAVLIALGGACLVAFGATFAAERWQSEKFLRGDPYGQLVRMIDPGEEAYRLPYYVSATVQLAAGVTAQVVAALVGITAHVVLDAAMYGIASGLITWGLVGFVQVLWLTFKNSRRAAQVLALKEELQAESRASARSRS